eukprot:gene20282-21157_t
MFPLVHPLTLLWAASVAAATSVVSVPHALDPTVCDALAAKARSIVGADGRGQLAVSPEAAELFVALGLTTTAVHEVNVRIEGDVDRWGVHVDRPLPGTPPEFEKTSIIYLTGGTGGLMFPDENMSVPFTKGGLVTFPAGVRHGVSEGSGARVMLGPFSETMTEVGVIPRRNARSLTTCSDAYGAEKCANDGRTAAADKECWPKGAWKDFWDPVDPQDDCTFEFCCVKQISTTAAAATTTAAADDGLSVGAAVGVAEAAVVALVAIGVGLNRCRRT